MFASTAVSPPKKQGAKRSTFATEKANGQREGHVQTDDSGITPGAATRKASLGKPSSKILSTLLEQKDEIFPTAPIESFEIAVNSLTELVLVTLQNEVEEGRGS
uniref:Uncharacterized protein n=1 Tax=Cannabis sativa TaxID=3483 RepID=A0A803Q4Z5_CANSA